MDHDRSWSIMIDHDRFVVQLGKIIFWHFCDRSWSENLKKPLMIDHDRSWSLMIGFMIDHDRFSWSVFIFKNRSWSIANFDDDRFFRKPIMIDHERSWSIMSDRKFFSWSVPIMSDHAWSIMIGPWSIMIDHDRSWKPIMIDHDRFPWKKPIIWRKKAIISDHDRSWKAIMIDHDRFWQHLRAYQQSFRNFEPS